MLLAIFPGPMVLSTVRPVKSTDSVLFVVDILSLVFAAISPLCLAMAVHLVVLPFALVFPVLAPHVDSYVRIKSYPGRGSSC
jgi:hypothetical protein